MNHIRVSVPATTANLGPGFDVLGLALNLRNRVELRRVSSEQTGTGLMIPGFSFAIEGFGKDTLPVDETNLIALSIRRIFSNANEPQPRFEIRCQNRIPTGSGLGSSSAAIIAGLVAGNAFLQKPLSEDELIRAATDLEGHPDNVAAALLGGLCVCHQDNGGQNIIRRIPVALWQVGVVVPAVDLPTEHARAILPAQISRAEMVHNLSASLLVVEALQKGDLPLLRIGMEDRVHQPYRIPQIPGAEEALALAKKTGSAAALSGAGPGLVVFHQEETAVQEAVEEMREIFTLRGMRSWEWLGKVSDLGALTKS